MQPKLLFLLFILPLFFLFTNSEADAQISDTSLVQFSGVVITDDSLKPIPFVNIFIKDNWRGTITDLYGFFSFVARKNEVVIFSAMGYKTITYVIPDTLTKDRYSLIQIMRPDTILMNETVIYPWPTYEQFKKAFVSTEIPDDNIERAKKNIEDLKNHLWDEGFAMDGSMNYRNYLSQRIDRMYYAGQMPPNNLLNPFAWAQFIKAWKEGKFKRKDKQ